jgi:hypothetical protein
VKERLRKAAGAYDRPREGMRTPYILLAIAFALIGILLMLV